MAINYTPSALDSNFTLLQEMHRISKYLHDNPIYKCYAVNTAYVSGTSQYDLSYIDGDATAFGEGDVVFFNNSYYAVVSSAGSEYFSIKNPTSFKGAQGEQGEQGEQGQTGANGQDGADGKDALIYKTIWATSSSINIGTSVNLANVGFSRVAETGDTFVMYVKNTSNNHSYICTAIVDNHTALTNECTITSILDITGSEGADGEIALVYGNTISFTYSSSEQLITETLPFANFNRTPKLNEDFIALLYDSTSGIEYIANCEVQSISGSNVSSIVASNIQRVSGQNGTNGTNGTDGADGLNALECEWIETLQSVPVGIETFQIYEIYFNRTPVVNDRFEMIMKYQDNNNVWHSYLGTILITSLETEGLWNCQLQQYIETTGQAGQNAQTLYLHSIKLRDNVNSPSLYIIANIISQRNTAVSGYGGLATFLYNSNDPSDASLYTCTGYSNLSGYEGFPIGLFSTGTGANKGKIKMYTGTGFTDITISDASLIVNDTVIAL